MAVRNDKCEEPEVEKLERVLSLFAHELRTPLTSLQALTQIVLRNEMSDIGAVSRDMLIKISDQTGKIGDLIKEMLDVTRLMSGRLSLDKSIFDFSTLLKRTAEKSGAAFSSHRIYLDIVSVAMDIDRLRMEQAVINLLGTVFRSLPAGAALSVRSALLDDTLVVLVAPANSVRIDADTAADPTFTDVDPMDRKDTSGAGTRLFIASQIIRLHNGRLRCRRDAGHGVSFLFVLPV